ncbi:MGMT family protein [Streptomyces albipurpureus]|uniref:MGMT family protein n=1 Tax=Streptomyces albipurpureus TaxID=2897419 RepID=A0ABT0UJK1_9ACTN|nr:MGMT family protein [Streptomyces sp. CWNU-1]MCM2388371.1 MGMT family protein [Streptomyces sp. CWNU-1]
MNKEHGGDAAEWHDAAMADSLSELADPAPSEQAPADFALSILRRAGVPPRAYDVYALLDAPGGGLYVASDGTMLTCAALGIVTPGPEDFEAYYRARTGRTAVRTTIAPTGVRTALRTGRAKQLSLDLSPLSASEQAALAVVRTIPRGQMRPVSWIAREATLPDRAAVVAAVLRNPLQLIIPCHRVAYDNGRPCDTAYGPAVSDELRAAEGIEADHLDSLARQHTLYLGSDTTRIYCHPTCAHARRITTLHQVPFRSAHSARQAGYRPCKSCRPAAA